MRHMRYINIRINSKTLRIKDCRGLSSVRGLMFDSLSSYDGAIIHGNSIWMPFVKQALQLIFLDKNYKITSVQGAKPLTANPRTWRMYSDSKASYCLELAKHAKARKGTRIKIL